MIDLYKLAERGYENIKGKMMAEKLAKVDKMFEDGIQAWLSDGTETDYTIEGIKMSDLIKKFSLKYPAAILSMDWLLRDPENAKKGFEKGVR